MRVSVAVLLLGVVVVVVVRGGVSARRSDSCDARLINEIIRDVRFATVSGSLANKKDFNLLARRRHTYVCHSVC